MTFVQLLALLRDAIARDAALEIWAQEHYGRSVSVLTRVDRRNPPPDDQFPVCHVYPQTRSGRQQLGGNRFTVGFGLGVHDDSDQVSAPFADNDQVEPGVERLDEFSYLVQTASIETTGSLTENTLFFEDIRVEYETVEFYPYFLATMEIDFQRPEEFF